MRIAFFAGKAIDPTGKEHVPAMNRLIERLASRHTLHIFVVQGDSQPVDFDYIGGHAHNPGRSNIKLPIVRTVANWKMLTETVRANGPFDVMHGFYGLPNGLVAALIGCQLHTPSVVTLIDGELVNLPEFAFGGSRTWQGRLMIALALKLATRVTCPTTYIAKLAHAHGTHAIVVPLGIDTSTFKRTCVATDGPPWRLLHVANLYKIKNQRLLLRAMQRIVQVEPRVHLDIVGRDLLNGALMEESKQLGLEAHVTFHGPIQNQALKAFMEQAHLMVMTSRYEAGQVVMLEAAACELPTVGTAAGYLADWHPDRACAVATDDETDDGARLAKAIVDLLNNHEARLQLAQRAHRWATTHDADWTVTAFETIFNDIATLRKNVS